MTSTQGHKFALAPWHIIREFAGIYGVIMDYSKFVTISVGTIEDAVKHSKICDPLVVAWNKRDRKYFRNPKAWKGFLLKEISRGYKSRKFYEEIALRLKYKDIVWRSQNAHLINLKDGAEERIREKRCARIKGKEANRGSMK